MILIIPTQMAFIKGRSISDNILLVHDILRTYEKSTITPRYALKIDRVKEFDSIEWEFLLDVLSAMSFHAIFMQWI